MADGGKVIIKIDADSDGFKKAMGGIGKIAGTAFKGIAVGAGAAATAIGAIGTAAVKSFADFEQLSGGAKKIFDEIDYSKIKADADEAFKTMQISANQYLQLMTTVGANFASTLGDEKGYEVAKSGMKAISDFATGTGRDIDELSQKYQMITKSTSSYQSIADQFAGVLPATSEQFLKQAQAAGLLEKKYKKLTDVPIAQYQEAVTQMLAKGVDALGLTDNAANEAATTLSGSINMFKASWDNLMTGLADPTQDLDVLIDNVINSAMAVMDNLSPVIDSVLESLPTMISVLGSKLVELLPGVIKDVLPKLAEAATNLIGVLVNTLSDNADSIGDTAVTIIMMLVNTLLNNIPKLIEAALVLLVALAKGLGEAAPELVPAIVQAVLLIVDTLVNNIDLMIEAGTALILGLISGLINAVPILVQKTPEIIISIVKALINGKAQFEDAGKQLIMGLGEGLKKYVNALKDTAKEVIGKIKGWFTGKDGFDIHSPSKWSEKVFAYVIDGGVNGIEKRKGKLLGAFKSLTADTRTEVEKVLAESNKTMLEGEKKYLAEKERLEKEEEEKEYKQKLANAKNAKAREKIKQEYVLKEQEDANKKYLDSLKEAADKEREIFEALQKDLENEKKAVVKTLTDLAESAYDKLEDVYDAQNDFADKLKDYGSLYKENKIVGDGGDITYNTLADLSQQTEELKKYGENIKKVTERGVLPKSLLNAIRGMSVEEGVQFTDMLLNARDDVFNKYIADWNAKEFESENIAAMLFGGDVEEAKKEIEKDFNELPESLFDIGSDSAAKFGQGFIEEIRRRREELKAALNALMADLFPTYGAAGNTSVTNSSYSPTYNILARGEGPMSYTRAMRDFEMQKKMAGGY